MNLNLVQASNRSGEAVRASVTILRTAGSSVITVDSLTNWPANFIATSGKLLTDNTIDPTSVLVFSGHTSGGTIVIDTLAPGYTDNGNSVADIVVIKPTTMHMDNLADFLGTSMNNDGSFKPAAVQTALQSLNILNWYPLTTNITAVTYNGQRSYDLTSSADLTATVSPGMRLRTTRTVAAPNQSASLNGTNQYFSKTTPSGMTFTVTCTAMGARKLNAYSVQWFGGRTTGTNGFRYGINANGQLVFEVQPGNATTKTVTSWQSVPLNKWFRFAFQIDLAGTCQIMLDGVAIPSATAGTATSLTQAGDWQVGAANGAGFTNGKIAQDALFSAKLTDNAVRSYESQSFSGSETSLISAYSFSNSITDLKTGTANNLTAQGSAVATNADSPFGGQTGGTISTTLDYGIVQKITSTTITVQVPEGCTIPTTGGVASISYSPVKEPYGFPGQMGKWTIEAILKVVISQSAPAGGTWYNIAGFKLNCPVGEWNIGHATHPYADRTTNGSLSASNTVSTTNSTETIPLLTGGADAGTVTANGKVAASVYRKAPVSVASQADYYLLTQAGDGGTTTVYASLKLGSVFAENTYL